MKALFSFLASLTGAIISIFAMGIFGSAVVLEKCPECILFVFIAMFAMIIFAWIAGISYSKWRDK